MVSNIHSTCNGYIYNYGYNGLFSFVILSPFVISIFPFNVLNLFSLFMIYICFNDGVINVGLYDHFS